MVMRDGMPGPGWWIASDGRWYPPELHPDVRASTAVVLDDPVSAPPVEAESSPSMDTPQDVSNGAGPLLGQTLSTNGTYVPTRDTHDAVHETSQTRRPSGQRVALGLALAASTLLVILYFARGHDVRPSLDSRAATTVQGTPAPTVQGTPAPTAQSIPATTGPATATSAASGAPSTTTRSVTTPTTSTKVAPRVVSVFELVKGNCLDGTTLNDGLITTIRIVDCADVHTHEVYYSGRYPASTYDATKISDYANDTCLAQFEPYVGIEYARSRYQYLHIVPTQESWSQDNDRDVVCVAFEEDATITGSIASRAQ